MSVLKPIMNISSIREKFKEFEKSLGFKNELKWTNIILIGLYHIIGVWWCYYYAFPVKFMTVVFACIMYIASGFGVTGGAHRLWTHKAYKVTLPCKLFMLTLFTAAGQNSLQDWVRDHRVHHKYSDTDADPHNANRGLFFSHIGWLLMKKNDQVIKCGNDIDMSDIYADPILNWHKKHFNKLKLLLCFVLPSMIGVWCWGEDWKCGIAWQCFIRYLGVFHGELTVNSLAHTFGYKPYNKDILPSENRFVATVTFGEGWHNYHHAFPFDYKAEEQFDVLNLCTKFIKGFEYIGWAYDLKEATPDMIKSISKRIGDGTYVPTY